MNSSSRFPGRERGRPGRLPVGWYIFNHEIHEKGLAGDTSDVDPWIVTEVDKHAKFHVSCPKIVE